MATALDLVTGLERGRRPASGRPHGRSPSGPRQSFRAPGTWEGRLHTWGRTGARRKVDRRSTASELGSDRPHSPVLPAQLQTLEVSEFPKIMNFTPPPNRFFMFPKKFYVSKVKFFCYHLTMRPQASIYIYLQFNLTTRCFLKCHLVTSLRSRKALQIAEPSPKGTWD